MSSQRRKDGERGPPAYVQGKAAVPRVMPRQPDLLISAFFCWPTVGSGLAGLASIWSPRDKMDEEWHDVVGFTIKGRFHDTPERKHPRHRPSQLRTFQHVLSFVHQYRVHLLMKDHCRAANSCKVSLIVGAPRVACNGLCTAAKFHSADENPGCLLGCSERSDRLFTYPRVGSLWRLRYCKFNLRRSHQGHGLNFRKLMYGKSKL